MKKKALRKKRSSKEDVDEVAIRYIEATERLENTSSKNEISEIREFQNDCIIKLKHLVTMRSNKYKRFSNHPDLEQDGFEALLLALRTFDPKKGIFGWWADKYISTRISRSANAHSTIRFPLKVAREMRPFKTNVIPTIIDKDPSALDNVESAEMREIISNAIKNLPQKNQQVINMTFGFNGTRSHTISLVLKNLSISRSQYIKLMQESKESIKQHILSLEESFVE